VTRLVYCPGVCRECGCTQLNACEDKETGETCGWAEDDLCTFCVPDEPLDLASLDLDEDLDGEDGAA
jgi:hypothetical protein